jgi:hypothetical protein
MPEEVVVVWDQAAALIARPANAVNAMMDLFIVALRDFEISLPFNG